MTPTPPPSLLLLPGTLLVIFVVRAGHAASTLFAAPQHFLETLQAACALTAFSELLREEDRLDELLPWAGNV